jgi:alpha-methylacyl-CoA racemase
LQCQIAGGSYPAALNILLALRQRDLTGQGCHLHIAITDHLFPPTSWALGQGFVAGQWPRPAGELLTGGSPRFQIYPTADQRFLAAAAPEQRFWTRFVELVGLEARYRDDRPDPGATTSRIRAIIRGQDAAHWDARFCRHGRVLQHRHLAGGSDARSALRRARPLRRRSGGGRGRSIPALPAPMLGEANHLLDA